ncbi:MAG: P-II family nitrogen regulator [Spirochaetales bacterium]|nr:P-II family nitrogen regulator [Spirochaetales bacterium]
MVLIRSVVRPEKSQDVMDALLDAGYPAVTKVSVAGRGQQKGLKLGNVVYDELPKELLITVVPEDDKDIVLKTIMGSAKTGEEGSFGDGKIFVSQVEETYTIRTGEKE